MHPYWKYLASDAQEEKRVALAEFRHPKEQIRRTNMESITKTILVSLHPTTQSTMLLRQLQPIVNPGDRIELLVAYREMTMPWFVAQLALMQTGSNSPVSCETSRTVALRDDLKGRLEREIAVPARRMFGRMDVHVRLRLYSGTLKRLIDRYLETGEVTILVGGPVRLRRLKSIVSKIRSRLFCRNTHELPILLVHAELPNLRTG
jgi:hypothetical protein